MKMKNLTEQREIMAGILLVAGLILLLFVVHTRQVDSSSDTHFHLYATFNKADGITKGSAVRLAGIPVGKVTQTELDPYYRVKMTLSFPKNLNLSTDTGAVIETDGLIGNKYIELTPGGDEELLENEDSIVYTQDALLLDELLNRFLEMMRAKKGLVTEGNEGEIS